nr:MAG TPA: hypothetical protein [Caudoviricetes sp.]
MWGEITAKQKKNIDTAVGGRKNFENENNVFRYFLSYLSFLSWNTLYSHP